MVWAEVPISVVNVETPSVVMCAVVVAGCCVAVAVDISVVALLSSVLDVVDPRSVVFGEVSSVAVVASTVVTLVAFD